MEPGSFSTGPFQFLKDLLPSAVKNESSGRQTPDRCAMSESGIGRDHPEFIQQKAPTDRLEAVADREAIPKKQIAQKKETGVGKVTSGQIAQYKGSFNGRCDDPE